MAGGPGEVAEMKLDVAEGVPGLILEGAAAELGDERQ
jgi:hypothetical protein